MGLRKQALYFWAFLTYNLTIMVDIKYIREHQEEVKNAIKSKRIDLDLEELLQVDKDRIELQRKTEELSAKKNELNDKIVSAKTP